MATFLLVFMQIAAASGLSMYERGIRLIDDRYLRVDELSVEEAFGAAADSAERSVPWLIVEHDGTTVRLRTGDTDVWNTVELTGAAESPALIELPDALERLETAIETFGVPLPPDLDLPVVLMRGVCRALDRHSVVLHKSRLDRFDQRIKGKLNGIGARIGREDGEIVILGVFDDGPAHAGGLQTGDVVLRVDGISTMGMSVSQSVERMRGPARTTVELQVRRRTEEGLDEVRELSFTRAEVNIPNVSWLMGDDGVGVIAIEHFSEHTSRLTAEALTELEAGTPAGLPMRGIVLDLRGNSGGSMIQAAETADLFLNDGVIVRTAGRGGIPVPNLLREIRAHPANAPPFEPEVPVVVLQNRGSASASEILAGSLGALDRAVLVGRTSHGKGTVQKVYLLRGGEDKVRLKLTVAEYRLTGDIPVHGEGVAPDLNVRRVRFHRYGASVPPEPAPGVLSLVDADERPGWREGATVDVDADPLMKLAARLVAEIAGPDRQAGMEALDLLVPTLTEEANARLSETFRVRELDWTASDEPQSELNVGAEITIVGTARAGERAELRAEVSNLGPAPLHQVRLRLSSETRSAPWRGVTIPIGFLPPGEKGMGSTYVELRVGQPDREDVMSVSAEADGLEAAMLDPVILRMAGREAPPMSVRARLVPHEDHHRVELELTNLGEENLTGVRARFAWSEDSGVELVDREGLLPVLGTDHSERVDLALRILNPEAIELPMQLRVEAEQFQEVLRVPVTVPVSGRFVTVAPPTITVEAPMTATVGEVRVEVVAEDNTAVANVEVWWQGDKLAYTSGTEKQIRLDLAVPLELGVHRLSIVARDEDGNRMRKVRYIRGEAPESDGDPAAMEAQPDE
jgi:C-terminal peptidase prc